MKDNPFGSPMRLLANAEEKLDTHSFPATTAEVIAEYGEVELDLPNGSETLGDALSRLGDETFPDAESAKTAARSAVSEKAIGRKGYSDRDSPAVGEDGPDQLSF